MEKMFYESLYHFIVKVFFSEIFLNIENTKSYIDLSLGCGTLVFSLAFLGLVMNKTNVILYMVGLEMLLLGCSLNYIFFSLYLGLPVGLLIVLIILGVAAAETSVGLGIIIAHYGQFYTVNMKSLERLGGI